MDWVRTQMTDLLAEGPAIAGGKAVFHEVSGPAEQQPAEQQQQRHPPLFAVVRTYHGLPGQAEAMHSPTSRDTVPAIEHAPGFRGFYAFRDEAEPSRAVSVTLFDTRDEALAAHEAVLAITRERLGEMDYELPTVAMGETLVLTRG